jgi:ribonuclease R
MAGRTAKGPERKNKIPNRAASLKAPKQSISELILKALESDFSEFTLKSLFQRLGLKQRYFAEYRRTVRQLIAEGRIQQASNRRLSLCGKSDTITGIIRLARGGYGFIDQPDGTSVFIPIRDAKRALDGDSVTVKITHRRHQAGPEGQIIEIDALSRKPQLGIITSGGRGGAVHIKNGPASFTAKLDLSPQSQQPKKGDWVLVALKDQLRRYPLPHCRLIRTLGKSEDKGITETGLLFAAGLELEYPAAAVEQAKHCRPELAPKGLRRDFRSEFAVTIDPEDAKDHDDAVSLRVDGDGNYVLGVHIADVSRFFPENSPIDQEARQRAFSTYLQHHYLPMLPPQLPGELCSLKPGKDRLALSVIINFDSKGRLIKCDIQPALIRIQRLISYETAESYLDQRSDVKADPELQSALLLMWNLAKILREKRLAAGGVNFDLPELGFLWGESAAPTAVFKLPHLKSHQLIEEFMLAANRSVADIWIDKFGSDAINIFRNHPPMDAEKRQKLCDYLLNAGFDWTTLKLNTSKDITNLLDESRRRLPIEITEAIARKALTLAKYETTSKGHFGLGFDRYLHFTSPIRRYADLTVHRLIWTYLIEGKSQSVDHETTNSALIAHINNRERSISELERDANKLAALHYLSERPKQVFAARLVEVYQDRFFLTLEGLAIEGELTPDSNIVYKPPQRRGERHRPIDQSGHYVSIGDSLKVKIAGIDLLNRKLELRPE